METWALILMIILIMAIGAMAVVVYLTEKKNSIANQKNILYPFTGNADSKGNVMLKDSSGNPQIDCSISSGKNGGTVNIIGAFFDIIDPYGECSPIASSVLDLSCGIPGSKITCTSQKDCGPGMKCSAGYCVPGTAKLKSMSLKSISPGSIDTDNSECGGNYCPVQPGTVCSKNGQSDCKDDNAEVMTCDVASKICKVNAGRSCFGVNLDYDTCAIFPLCSHANVTKKNNPKISTITNATCSGGNNLNACMSRDASAYLAGKCDDKESCAIN